MANIKTLLFLFRDVNSSENFLVKVLDGCCFLFRHRCRSRLVHLWLPNEEHSARRAGRYLCCCHGLSTSWPSCRSVSAFALTTKEEVSLSPLCTPHLSSVKLQTVRRISELFSLMCRLICEEQQTFNKITKVWGYCLGTSSIYLTFKVLLPVSPGPAFNLFLRLCDFKLGPFVVNKYTSPGVTASRQSVIRGSPKGSWIQKSLLYILNSHALPPFFCSPLNKKNKKSVAIRPVRTCISVSIPWCLNETPVAAMQLRWNPPHRLPFHI